MAWFNPFSWGGGPDEANWGPMRQIASDILAGGQRIQRNIEGIDFGVNEQDQQQWGASYGHMRDLVLADLMQKLPNILGQASGQAGARGLAGSGIEAQMRAARSTEAQRGTANILSQFGANQAGQMAAFAAQRGQHELSRNQQLWNTLLQSYQPMMDVEGAFLKSEQERIAKEKSAFGKLLGTVAPILAGTYGTQPQQQQQGGGSGGMSPSDLSYFQAMTSFPILP